MFDMALMMPGCPSWPSKSTKIFEL